MKVFLTGCTGYVGREVARHLIKANHSVVALIREGTETKIPSDIDGKIQLVFGDLKNPESYRSALKGVDAIINLPGLLREFPNKGILFEEVHFLGAKNLINEAKTANINRFIQMSALGVRENSITKYQITKFKAEEYLRSSGLQFTIFRPSLIFGNEKEGMMNFFSVLNELLEMLPFFVPVIGNGNYLFQPVSIQNIAEGITASLSNSESIAKEFDVAGQDRYSYNQLLEMIMHVTGNYKIKFYQPISLMKIVAGIFGKYKWFPVTKDQIIMLEENSISDNWKNYYDTFNIKPIRLVEAINKNFTTK